MNSVTVDTREPEFIPDRLEVELGGLLKLETLYAGDYAWVTLPGKKRGVERKTWSDLVASLRSGRLEEELAKCLETYDQVDLLVEGAVSYHAGLLVPIFHVTDTSKGLFFSGTCYSTLTAPAYCNFLSSLAEHGIGYLFSPGLEYTPGVLIALWKRDQKLEEAHKFLRSKVGRPKASVYRIDPKVYTVMAACPRLPEKVAEALCKEFGGLGGMLRVIQGGKERTLLRIEGFGPKFLATIKERSGLNGNSQ